MKVLKKYTNGNYKVTIYSDGTKLRDIPDGVVATPSFPEAMDIKITNYCDAGCAFCHENSTREGVHGDLDALDSLLGKLPSGIELAIGGGNPLSHPRIEEFLMGQTFPLFQPKIPNLTVNSFHILKAENQIKRYYRRGYFYGLGISYLKHKRENIKYFLDLNPVIHLILGVHDQEDVEWLRSIAPRIRILFLGYKTFGRGVYYKEKLPDVVAKHIEDWKNNIQRYMMQPDLIISFDNLAIKQLELQRFFTKEMWNTFYMGDDGRFTMYLDAVKQEYAISSTSKDRYPWADLSIQDMFAHIRSLTDDSVVGSEAVAQERI